MKTMFKKNQLMITAIAIMIAIAGYLQFADGVGGLGKKTGEKEVGSDNVIAEQITAGEYTVKNDQSDDLVTMLDLSEEDLMVLGSLSAAEQGMDIASLDDDGVYVMENYPADEINSAPENAEAVSAQPEEGEIPGEAVFTSAGVEILTDAKLLKEQTRARNKATLLDIIESEGVSEQQKQQAINSMVEMTEIAERETAAEILLEAKGFSDVIVSITGDSADVVVNAVGLTEVQRAQIEDIVRRKTNIAAENIIISTVVRE